jgi:hypothetical protein
MKAWMSSLAAGAILTLSYTAPAAVPQAKAHGKRMNITAYCNAVYNPDGRGPSWRAKYYPGPGQWWCEEATIMGPQMRGGGRKLVTPAKACLRMHRTSRIHTHKRLNYAVETNMHCGEYVGLAPSMADMQPTSLTICNNTSAARLSVGYAFLDRRGTYAPNWRSTGHYVLGRGDCKTIDLPAGHDEGGYRGDLYVYGAHRGGIMPGQGRPMCVWRLGDFERPSADQRNTCTQRGYSMVPTTRIQASVGNVRHAFVD